MSEKQRVKRKVLRKRLKHDNVFGNQRHEQRFRKPEQSWSDVLRGARQKDKEQA